MIPQTYIFIGQSGCGKGTQADLLFKYLEQKGEKDKIYRLETGKRFRQFIEEDHYSNNISRDYYLNGKLQPEFVAIWMWADHMLRYLEKDKHMIIDGSPRKLHEALVLDSAIKFYDRAKPNVVNIKVSDEWARQRLTARHRLDDKSEEITSRLAWFHSDVEPAIDWYRKNENYNFVEINGEQSIENVHGEIIRRIF